MISDFVMISEYVVNIIGFVHSDTTDWMGLHTEASCPECQCWIYLGAPLQTTKISDFHNLMCSRSTYSALGFD
jgi:hypothetical protein